MRILCVDDDRTTRLYYSAGLAEALPADAIEVASSGEEAVERLEDGGFDVVITDLVMPGLDGIDVLRAAKRIDPRIEVIVITGQASVSSAIEALRGGARDYAEKPISIPLILEKLENVRDHRRHCAEADELRVAMETAQEDGVRQLRRLERRLLDVEAAVGRVTQALRDPAEQADGRVARALEALESVRRSP